MFPNRQHSRTTACALMSDHDNLRIQLQLYSWGFALIKFCRKQETDDNAEF